MRTVMQLALPLLMSTTLAACATDQDRSPTHPTITSAGTTATPTPTTPPPTKPAQADDDNSAGAAAFVDYYIKVFNHAASTGDTTTLRKLSHPDCTGCLSYADSMANWKQEGTSPTGDLWTLDRTNLSVSPDRNPVTVDARIDALVGATTKPYWLSFKLGQKPPYTVHDITILEQ